MSEHDIEFEFVSRYGSGPGPDPETVCKGQCEGMGFYPTGRDGTEAEIAAWDELHAKPHDEPCDGWHFIKCADCGGTGKR
jgi:hypothetical protein